MKTIELNGVTLILTEETADQIMAEVEEERRERREHWMLWNWYGRRWAMYGNAEDGGMFSDLYKDLNGCRPHMSKKEVLWILYDRENWELHDPYCIANRRWRARGWR